MAALALGLLAVVGCHAPAPPAPAAAPAADPPAARPAGLVALRPKLTLAGGRTSYAGIAFLVEGDRPLALVSSHVLLGVLRGDTIAGIDLVNAQSKDRLATATGFAGPPGPPMDGFDFSTDVAALTLDAAPEGVGRLALAMDRPRIGDAIEVLACPPDGASPEVTVEGEVSYASSTLLEVQLRSPSATRGFAGAPILLRSTGELVGMLQTVTAGATGVALARATPAEAIRPRLADAAKVERPLPLGSWNGSAAK